MDLQRSLNVLGFDAGPVNGLPGRQTRAAVRAFQSSRGFPVTGELTRLQQLSMLTEATRVEAGGVTSSEVRRAEALELQSFLEALSCQVGTPDGAWGPQSQQALDAFRLDLGVGAPPPGTPPGQSDRAALYAQVHGTPPVADTGAKLADGEPDGSAAPAAAVSQGDTGALALNATAQSPAPIEGGDYADVRDGSKFVRTRPGTGGEIRKPRT